MTWEIFNTGADRYEAWYATREGHRVDQAERKLLAWLLHKFPLAESALEIGCGTGHFTAHLRGHGLFAVGLDRAPAMLATLRRVHPHLPAVLGDMHELPFSHGAFDLTVFITALEFLDRPVVALSEAIRVSRMGVVLIVLNKWSLGGLSRRWGKQAYGSRLAHARDYALPELVKLIRQVEPGRIEKYWWMSTLLPVGPVGFLSPIPIGDAIGLAVKLRPT